MNLRRASRYALLVPLILLVILARDWVERPVAFESEETIDMRATRADYYLEGFTTRRFDADGALEYLVSGATLSHFPDDGRSDIDAPRLELRRPGVLWTARAERGRLDVDPDVFTLLGDVRLERTGTREGMREAAAGATVTILAEDLAVELDSNEVSTDAAFEVVADGWRLEGVGLRSSIEAGKLVLLSDVNGTYDAASPD